MLNKLVAKKGGPHASRIRSEHSAKGLDDSRQIRTYPRQLLKPTGQVLGGDRHGEHDEGVEIERVLHDMLGGPDLKQELEALFFEISRQISGEAVLKRQDVQPLV